VHRDIFEKRTCDKHRIGLCARPTRWVNRAGFAAWFVVLACLAAPPLTADDDDEIEFTGRITSIDGSRWVIGGRIVVVTPDTELEAENGPLVVGACVEVEGDLLPDGRIEAEEIESEEPGKCGSPGSGSDDNSSDDDFDDDDFDDDDFDDDDFDDDSDDDDNNFGSARGVEFKGIIGSIPAGGRAGAWRVGGRTVIADSRTEIEADERPLVIGGCAEVEGVLREDGVILAREIESESPSDCGRVADGQSGKIEFHGVVDSLPNGLIGRWNVSGWVVEVSRDTELSEDDGPFRARGCVEVEGILRADEIIVATEVETEDDDDCGLRDGAGGSRMMIDDGVEVEFYSELQQRPSSGRNGVWIIGGTRVSVDSDTELELDRGPASTGACLKVEGREKTRWVRAGCRDRGALGCRRMHVATGPR
jgi:hypothetical protein